MAIHNTLRLRCAACGAHLPLASLQSSGRWDSSALKGGEVGDWLTRHVAWLRDHQAIALEDDQGLTMEEGKAISPKLNP